MAKFVGSIGYVTSQETAPGVFSLVTTERAAVGDILRSNHSWQASEDSTNHNLRLNNRISIVADPFVNQNFDKIRFVRWIGTTWEVTGVDVDTANPRVTLTIGGVYNGN
jgi:hypothetical protein